MEKEKGAHVFKRIAKILWVGTKLTSVSLVLPFQMVKHKIHTNSMWRLWNESCETTTCISQHTSPSLEIARPKLCTRIIAIVRWFNYNTISTRKIETIASRATSKSQHPNGIMEKQSQPNTHSTIRKICGPY